MSSEVSATDELWQVEQKTNSDGTVDGKIQNWEKKQHHRGDVAAYIKVRLPNGETFKEKCEWPAADDPFDNTFVRVVDYCGYTLSAADQIEGETIPCKKSSDGWEIAVGRPFKPKQYLREAWEFGITPITLLIHYHRLLKNDDIVDPFFYALFSGILLFVWGVALFFSLVVVNGLIEGLPL